MFSDAFKALLHEAHFTYEMLGTGATQVRKAMYASKGMYFQSFTSLATGLERLGKLCLILDFIADHNGSLPDDRFNKHLKQEVGHKLLVIYDKLRTIQLRRDLKLEYLTNLDDPIRSAILGILSDFATGDRYSNIAVIAGGQSSREDPVAAWHRRVDEPLCAQLPEKVKGKIRVQAEVAGAVLGLQSMVLHFAETGAEITDMTDASHRTGLWSAVGRKRQLYVLQVIRYFVEMTWFLQSAAEASGSRDIPALSEIFAIFYNDDSMFRSRKTWLL